ncbi:hypothetical protein [Bergeriella denitrificans]|uniref:hypothetical protein n=1 Tax=Bergeriella denitrificans TaxID=494 RepID=UPI001FEAFB09|nr:hypothetical protein [Bergeriella denitrificans]
MRIPRKVKWKPPPKNAAGLIKLLHVAKSKLLLARWGTTRCLLANVSQGKTSSTKLSLEELELALRAMKARGFVVAAKPQGRRRGYSGVRAAGGYGGAG